MNECPATHKGLCGPTNQPLNVDGGKRLETSGATIQPCATSASVCTTGALVSALSPSARHCVSARRRASPVDRGSQSQDTKTGLVFVENRYVAKEGCDIVQDSHHDLSAAGPWSQSCLSVPLTASSLDWLDSQTFPRCMSLMEGLPSVDLAFPTLSMTSHKTIVSANAIMAYPTSSLPAEGLDTFDVMIREDPLSCTTSSPQLCENSLEWTSHEEDDTSSFMKCFPNSMSCRDSQPTASLTTKSCGERVTAGDGVRRNGTVPLRVVRDSSTLLLTDRIPEADGYYVLEADPSGTTVGPLQNADTLYSGRTEDRYTDSCTEIPRHSEECRSPRLDDEASSFTRHHQLSLSSDIRSDPAVSPRRPLQLEYGSASLMPAETQSLEFAPAADNASFAVASVFWSWMTHSDRSEAITYPTDTEDPMLRRDLG